MPNYAREIRRPGRGWCKHDGNVHPWLDWVVCGGMSGPGAVPMDLAWARDLRDQCKAAGVPFFFKQWGEWLPVSQSGNAWGDIPKSAKIDYFSAKPTARVGKKAAGHLLDGVEHREYPK